MVALTGTLLSSPAAPCIAELLAGKTPALRCTGVGSDCAVGMGFRMNLSQGSSQSELATPNTMKKILQPAWARSMPPRSVPTAGPEACPAEMSELARPRCDSEKWREMILLYEGYATDSPMPRMRRITSSDVKPLTRAVPNVAADHTRIPRARTQTTGKRSTSQPETIWK